MILDELIGWAKAKNIAKLRLDIYSQNESAVKAYEKAGFESLLTIIRMKV